MVSASTSQLSPRQALSDLTNDAFFSPKSSTRGKRLVSDHGVVNKRIKLTEDEANKADKADENNEDVDMMDATPVPVTSRRRRTGIYNTLQSLRMGDPVARRRFTLPTAAILESFVSSNKADLFKCHSLDSNSFLTPPYACAYSHASKRGQESILAVATEQGSVDILNTANRMDWEPESRRTLQVHRNGIFDVKWSPSDAFIATVSGDRSICITDPQSSAGTFLYKLDAGHASTVKCVAWDPSHNDLLASGGRDGCICLWDLRERAKGGHGQDVGGECWRPAMSISYTHEVVAGKPAKKGRAFLAPKSVTSLVYLPDSPYEILSGGSGDGIVRKWDLRFVPSSPTKRSKKPVPILPIDNAAEDLTTLPSGVSSAGLTFSPRRARGIISLALGSGPSAGRIFALSYDSRVHTYNALGAVGAPLSVPQADQAYAHRHMVASSFYIRTVVSPCGRWLATGGAGGSAFLFDVGTAGGDKLSMHGVELNGQEGEIGAVDWSDGSLATCADDGTVRIWRPDVERHGLCTNNPEEAKWDWSWGKV